MARQDFSFAFALCLSLLLHTLLLGTAAELYSIRTQGGRSALSRLLALEPPPPVPPTPPHDPDVDENDPTQRIGASTGDGLAIMESPGDMPQQAPKASQDQPFLSRDPVGPGKVGEDPTDSVLPLGNSGQPAPPPQEQVAPAVAPQHPPAQAAPPAPQAQSYLGETNSDADFAAPFDPKPRPENPTARLAPPQEAREQEPSPPAPAAPQTPPAPPNPLVAMAPPPAPAGNPGDKPGASSAADPAPMSDSEIDPVSTVGSAEFSPGSTKVRLGRKTKLTRPHLSLAAQTELMTMPTAAVVLRIKIDPTGKVISAEVARSSGNPAVDQPCKLAAYNWWFEPLKDNLGRPTKDVIMFAIRFI